MNEFFASNRLSAYLDGELSPVEAAEVERALQQNPELRQELERLQATIGFLREHGPVPAPPGFHARVMERVADHPLPGGVWARFKRFFTVVPMETVAVAVAAIVVAVVIGQRMEPDAPTNDLAVEQGEASTATALGEEGTEASQTEKMQAAANAAAELLTEGSATPERAEPPERQVATYESAPTRKEALPSADDVAGTLELAKDRLSTKDGVAALVEDAEGAGSGDPRTGAGPSVVSDAIALQAAVAYRLHTDDSKALRLLQGIVARNGGVVIDADTGLALDASSALGDGGDRKSLVVVIDPARIPALAKELGTMGMLETLSSDSSQLVGAAETMRIHLDLMYEP